MDKVLIVGAGIAGEALAALLGRAGWRVTVVEVAPGPRSGGQTVDLRGSSAAALERMGLLEACRARLIAQRGIAWVDAGGHRMAQMPVEAFGGRGFVSSAELLRADLAAVLHDAAVGAGAEHRFDDPVTALEPAGTAVEARFRRSRPEGFDLVVGADGAHSAVRRLVFGPEEAFVRRLGLAHAWFTVPQSPATGAVDGWYLVHNAPGSRLVELRPGRPGQLEAGFTFPAEHLDRLPDRRDREAQHALLEEVFAGVGWRAPQLLAAARAAEDFAVDSFDQIHTGTWSRGRVVLLGDAAWCTSPLSGLGTALALTGAVALADALGDHPLPEALHRYEAAVRPRARAAQQLPPGRVRTYAPRTTTGIRASAALMTLLQHQPAATLLEALVDRKSAHGSDRAPGRVRRGGRHGRVRRALPDPQRRAPELMQGRPSGQRGADPNGTVVTASHGPPT
ncbi:FAD-dependent monooxygenase [Quadrisphaera sp. DSM 44207]|uniref:FAD-dependent monooxygenase n=1 Tax=Quadrisphaera sp. DSM 44207 TaxID=1881057 RepID=UPI00088ABD60|nr:FAD-dependent monooxygenase [Quadrisphaera sp. DSM 44207]SDQ04097.1 2-polyprenyl-6-methoxyphenol hydroxylase [Quadrisphaera sp. DSM 44207]